jgi:hypothetical protein
MRLTIEKGRDQNGFGVKVKMNGCLSQLNKRCKTAQVVHGEAKAGALREKNMLGVTHLATVRGPSSHASDGGRRRELGCGSALSASLIVGDGKQ